MQKIRAICSERQVPKDEWLFRRDQPAEHLYLVQEGAVELLMEVNGTIDIPITLIRPGDGCAGIGALIEPYTYSLSARCAQDSVLLAIRRTDILELIERDAGLGRIIMTNLARKLSERLVETRQEVKLHFMNLVKMATV
jgi:CRP-like cAMP-binding protein